MALPVRPDPTDRRAAVVRMLAASPEGLSDAALARELGDGVRPQTVNQLCRRMAAEGELERVGTRPILNRLPARSAPSSSRTSRTARTARTGAPGAAGTARNAAEAAAPAPEPVPVPSDGGAPAPDPATGDTPAVRPEPASGTVDPPAARDAGGEQDVAATPSGPSGGAAGTGSSCGPLPYDALQAWSRVVNVQALVAGWLVRRGATLRSASVDGHGPARDLVASLDGDDVHVEVTGWPADGARTHPTTVAGDWFTAAAQAAAERRRAHPRARIVIALPDTRRYRSLTEQRAEALAGARAEVWFVDRTGSVHAR